MTPWRKWPPGAREENRKGQAEEEVPRVGLGKEVPTPALSPSPPWWAMLRQGQCEVLDLG